LQVNFDISYLCNDGLGNATVTVDNFTGGSGAYEINNTLSLTSGSTDSVTFIDVVGSSVDYFSVEDNTWYVQVRDQADDTNRRVKSITVDCVVPDDCVCWTVVNAGETSGTVDYYACDGSQPIEGIPGGATIYICVIRNTTPVTSEDVTATLCSPEVTCSIANPMCDNCSNTTTTTTTTSTTTTTTTAYQTKYLVELCGGGLGPYIVTLASGETPSGIGQAFKISGNSGAGFDGVNCWTVLEIDPSGTVDYAGLAFGSVFSDCDACSA
jgi:hypothetical protein